MKGLFFNIQDYSTHDGEGIRTVVFFKGCPLKCVWCSNPEGQKTVVEKYGESTIGFWMTPLELCERVKKNHVFFRNSGGGITFSGGEPFACPEFIENFLTESAKSNLSVGVETSGFFNFEKVKSFITSLDFIFFDVKVLDAKQHLAFTGVDNTLIQENLKKLSSIIPEKIIVTLPLIGGVNDDTSFRDDLLLTMRNLGLRRVKIHPYHDLGTGKYEKLGREYMFKKSREADVHSLKEFLAKNGFLIVE